MRGILGKEEGLTFPDTPCLFNSGIKRLLCTSNYKCQHFMAVMLKHEALSSPARKGCEVKGLVIPPLSFSRACKAQ